MPPAISCMALTYGRPHLLEEAIQSFLLQDYEGQKELIVLNDLPDQTLIFNHPEVKVINVAKRFKTIGEKRNAAAALCTHDILGVWDEDDIYLKHRLSYSIKMKGNKRYFKPTKAFFLHPAGNLTGPHKNWFCCNALWDRGLFNESGMYSPMNSGQDADLERKMYKILGENINFDEINIKDIYYLYRWRGNSYHLSNFGPDKKNEPTGCEKVDEFIKNLIKKNEIKTGNVMLNPHWKIDYTELVGKFIQQRDIYVKKMFSM